MSSWQLQQYGGDALWAHGRGATVRVAVLDSATRSSSPLPEPRFSAFDDRGRPSTSQGSDHGHSCAALIGATHKSSPGVAPECEIVSIAIETSNGPNASMVERAIRFALSMQCDVISCSFVLATAPATLLEALRDAHLAGVPIIAAGGNSNDLFKFPRQVKDVVVVGGVTRARRPMTGAASKWVDVSTWGDRLHVAAPNNRRVFWQGESSGATALVAGLVSLAFGPLSVPERRKRGQQIEHHLTTTADRTSPLGDALPLVHAARFLSAVRSPQ